MARKARLKSSDAIYHIICKSISEVTLFRNSEDKEKYLSLIKKYKKIYNVKIYGYCLMDNHAHLLVDSNGSDISRVMHGVNFSYARYFNKKYKRDSHLFKDRFKSKIIDNDRYMRTVSLYVHNNPKDICEFKNCPEKYAFSSLAIYLGKKRDPSNLVDYGFVMSLFGNTMNTARKNYYNLIFSCNDEKLKEVIEFKDEKAEYKSGRKILLRNFKSENVIDFIAASLNISKFHLNTKYSRKFVGARALAVVLMRGLCNFKLIDISRMLGNITHSRISKLCSIGIELIETDENFQNIMLEFTNCYSK